MVITAIFAAGLLRLRELEADRQAAEWMGTSQALDRILAVRHPGPRAGWRRIAEWFLRPLERHPSAVARVAALRGALGTTATDITYPLAVGVVVPLAMNTAFYVTWTLDFAGGEWPPVGAAAAVGSILLGVGLTPGLIRRAVAARRAGAAVSWWRPVAGTAFGLLIGLLVPPTTLPGATLALVSGEGVEYTVVKVLVTVAAGAGIATLAAGIASLAAAGEPYRGGKWLVPWLSLAVTCAAAAALWPIVNPGTGAVERLFLTISVPAIQWRWLALPYMMTAFLLGARLRLRHVREPQADTSAGRHLKRPQPGRVARGARALLAPAALPACAAIIGTTLFLPHSLLRWGAPLAVGMQVFAERWWICTLIGWIVLAVLAIGRGVPGLPRAWVSGWLATLLAGAELIVYGMFHGHRPSLLLISLTVAKPSVWLFYLGVPTACLALLRVRPPAVPRARWLLAAGSSAGAATAAVAVVGLAVPLASITAFPPSPSSPSPVPTPTFAAADPTRVLTPASARLVIGDVSTALSPTWTGRITVTAGAAGAAGPPPPPVSPAACGPLAREDFVNSLPTALVKAAGQYQAVPGVIPIGSATLLMTVESFARPVSASLFTGASADLRACHSFTVPGSRGAVLFTVRDVAPRNLGVPSWQVVFSVVFKHQRVSLTWIFVGIGHNLIMLTQQTTAFGALLPLQQGAISAALHAALSGLGHVPAG